MLYFFQYSSIILTVSSGSGKYPKSVAAFLAFWLVNAHLKNLVTFLPSSALSLGKTINVAATIGYDFSPALYAKTS